MCFVCLDRSVRDRRQPRKSILSEKNVSFFGGQQHCLQLKKKTKTILLYSFIQWKLSDVFFTDEFAVDADLLLLSVDCFIYLRLRAF